MKKRLITMLLAVCFIVPCMFMLTACGKMDVVGKTFVYEDMEFEFADSYPEAKRKQQEDFKNSEENFYADTIFTFRGNTVIVGNGETEQIYQWEYLNEEKTELIIYKNQDMSGEPTKFKISGKKLICVNDYLNTEGLKWTLIFKQGTCEKMNVVGKTFVCEDFTYEISDALPESTKNNLTTWINAMQQVFNTCSFECGENTITEKVGNYAKFFYWKHLNEEKTLIGVYDTEEMTGDPTVKIRVGVNKLVIDDDKLDTDGYKLHAVFKQA